MSPMENTSFVKSFYGDILHANASKPEFVHHKAHESRGNVTPDQIRLLYGT